MGNIAVWALRIVIALSLAGSIVTQAFIVPAIWRDLEHVELWARIVFVTIIVLGIVCMQVFAVCVWQLLTLVRRGAVFSTSAFRYVDVIAVAIGVASCLAFAMAVLLAPGGTAPGIVGLICGASLVLAGFVLLVVVMRRLLAQAVEREHEARALRSELSEVI